MGVYPVYFSVSGPPDVPMFCPYMHGYFIDKKGNIVGTYIPPSEQRPPAPHQPPVETNYEVQFKFTQTFLQENPDFAV
jgi:hypothetical protein